MENMLWWKLIEGGKQFTTVVGEVGLAVGCRERLILKVTCNKYSRAI